ncbi:PREDICTED: THAP domain-containing protein 3 isoform X1 [Gavialis gangeticus]|uniref:THAP domain-containing protein 3 isoform X1 n=1 Tax=Gavialis gangeticus TaxID=94835 RepID=UPI00092E4EBE|nr:PREDICTED: THAP domain-containing protein 3 isoform X1 [Gavialis gangeticus]
MPKSCAAPRCSNRYSSRCRHLTFHRFPRSRPELLARWVGNLGRTDFQPSRHAVLCSQHFQPDCFSPCGNRANLRPDAVPTLFTTPPAANVSLPPLPGGSGPDTAVPCLGSPHGTRRGPQQIGKGKSSLKDAEDPPLPKDCTDSWKDSGLEVEAVLQEPQSTTEQPVKEVTTTEAAETEDRQLKSRPLMQRHHPQSSDHSYAIADCTSLKKKLFQALEENEKLRKCLKVKSVELKRILVRLQTCKKEH